MTLKQEFDQIVIFGAGFPKRTTAANDEIRSRQPYPNLPLLRHYLSP